MGKALSLFKASMTEGMSFFRISGRNRSKFSKVGIPIIVGILFMSAMASYGYMMMEPLAESGMEYVILTIFAVISAIVVLVEGIYKASGLLFNCRDDDTVLALPIQKSTVLLIRMMKFYIFEVMVNTLFLAPVMITYGVTVSAPISFYLVSMVALLMLPILPVVIACLIGGVISFFSTKFRFKNLAQIILTTVILIVAIFASFKMQGIMGMIAQNAESINETICAFYYPVGQYIDLVLHFDILGLLIFVVTNVGLLVLMVLMLGKVYYKINSRAKVVKNDTRRRNYKISAHRPMIALIKKEIGRFVSSPVFVVNAGFGLVLFILACVVLCINADSFLAQISGMEVEGLSAERVIVFIPAVLFGLVFVMSMMTSITSSMISLEGKSFNILKSLPASAVTIILAKVLSAMVVMVPVFLIGDLMMFLRFDFNIWQILMILISSVVMPMVAELLGIIVNLKYPKMDAKDDVEVVKQSMSSMIAVFIGFAGSGVMGYIIYMAFVSGMSATETIGAGLVFGIVMLALLMLYLKWQGVKEFNSMNV